MANGTMATPTLLTDPGFLYWAPLGSTIPTNTVAASVFSDTWPVAWIALGMTDTGTKLSSNLTVQPVPAAEVFDPLAYRTTDRATTVTFSLLNFTATNLSRTLNGAATTVTGTGATTMTSLTPPKPGAEVRCMIGFESLDSTYRFIAYQVINSGSIDLEFAKAPARTMLPWTANLEVPSSGNPYSHFFAGTNRG